MKKLFLVLAIIGLASCNSNDDSGDANINEFEQIKTTLPQGEWKITKLIDGTSDHTADFDSFVFTFNENGTVIAANNILSEQGTWAYDNSSSSGEELVLKFNETAPFDEINDDWDIVSVSNSKIELIDISGGNGGTDNLIFEKI